MGKVMMLRCMVWATLTVFSLTACGAGPQVAVPQARVDVPTPAPERSEDSRPTETPRQSTTEAMPRETREPVSCVGAGDVAVSFSPVDAGLGNRWLVLTVRNCSEGPITLPAEPVFEGINDDGTTHPASWRWDEPQGSLVLGPGNDKFVVAHWLSNGRCERGVRELRIHLLGESFSAQDCFQFGGETAPEREGGDGDLYWADDPSQPPGWQPS